MESMIQWMVRQYWMAIWRLALFIKSEMSELSVTPHSWMDNERHLGFDEE